MERVDIIPFSTPQGSCASACGVFAAHHFRARRSWVRADPQPDTGRSGV